MGAVECWYARKGAVAADGGATANEKRAVAGWEIWGCEMWGSDSDLRQGLSEVVLLCNFHITLHC